MNDAQIDMRTRMAILWAERRTRPAPDESRWSSGLETFFLLKFDGKRSAIRDQLKAAKSLNLMSDKSINWFQTGLTYNMATGKVEWLGSLVTPF